MIKHRLWSLIYSLRIRKKKVYISSRSIISKKTVFGGYNKVGPRVNLVNSYVERGTYLASNIFLPYTRIGQFCSIASGVRLVSGQHPTNRFVSTHPAFYSLLKQAGFTFVNEQLFEEYRYADKANKYKLVIGKWKELL